MNEARAPTNEKLKEQILNQYKKGVKPKELSEKTGVSINTIKSWIKREKEKVNSTSRGASEKKEGAPSKKKKGAPIGNKNAQGAGVPERNKNAEKHGFYSKYLPKEVVTIIKDIEEKKPLEILWENIQISYAAILRAQKIMYVNDKEELIKEVKKISKGDKKNEVEWEFQFSWDRQSTFLMAQSRAMAELRSQIKQYDDMIHANWKYITEEQKARISKIKAETERLQTENNNENDIVDNWIATAMSEVSKTEKGGSE